MLRRGKLLVSLCPATDQRVSEEVSSKEQSGGVSSVVPSYASGSDNAGISHAPEMNGVDGISPQIGKSPGLSQEVLGDLSERLKTVSHGSVNIAISNQPEDSVVSNNANGTFPPIEKSVGLLEEVSSEPNECHKIISCVSDNNEISVPLVVSNQADGKFPLTDNNLDLSEVESAVGLPNECLKTISYVSNNIEITVQPEIFVLNEADGTFTPAHFGSDGIVIEKLDSTNIINIETSRPTTNENVGIGPEKHVVEINGNAAPRPTTNSSPNFNLGPSPSTDLTKEGNPRKRKKYELSVQERKKLKRDKIAEAHFVKGTCSEKCKIKCSSKISEERQKEINKQFWELNSAQERKSYVLSSVSKMAVKRRTSGPDSRRSWTNEYILKTTEGTCVKVCKLFFLYTLGYDKNNDKIVQNLSNQKHKISPKPDGRKGKIPKNKADHNLIINHIESFEPKISHYRREHAPNRRYLPSDLSITQMHQDFLKKHPNVVCSYDLYRSEVARQKISFVKLGNEECEMCEHFILHGHTQTNMQENCDTCNIWNNHIKKADAARIEYKKDADTGSTDSRIVYSVDMEKVIMLPRCEMFKNVIFTKRLTVYNESFVPVGKKSTCPIVACLWHDAIRGRNKEELISTIYKFLLTNCRDIETVVLWMDNCSAQNKNWAFFCFLLFVINSSEICASSIEIKYFEPGHTFMSCDSFHHMVEQSLHRVKKVYDFEDFKKAVQSCSSRVNAIEMTPNDFFQWKDYSAKRTPKKGKKNQTLKTRRAPLKVIESPTTEDNAENGDKINEEEGRPYLRDIVQVKAQRGCSHLFYRTSYDQEGEWKELHFLTSSAQKNGLKLPPSYTNPIGISAGRKSSIISSLLESQKGIVPENRFSFWKQLPIAKD